MDEAYYNYAECCYCGALEFEYDDVDCESCGKKMCMYLVQLTIKEYGEKMKELIRKENEEELIRKEKMTDGIPQFSTTNTDYGEVLHSTILKVFGDEFTYNELEPYTRDKDDTSHLEVKEERNNHRGFMFISVYIDKHKIMEKKYDVNWSCDMFYYLRELEEY